MKNMNSYMQAKKLHNLVPVTDSHNDLAGELLYRHRHGEERVIERLYLPHLKAAHFKLIVSSVYIENSVFFPEAPDSTENISSEKGSGANLSGCRCKDWNDYLQEDALNWEQGYQNALAQIDVLKQEIDACSKELQLVTSAADLDALQQNDKIGILMYMEGLDCIGSDLNKLDELYALGIRGASLTWSRRNQIATGCCTATKRTDIPGAITNYGCQVIHRMQELGMFLDISHLNNEGFSQLTDIPFIATHSNAFSVYANYRNLTDAQMERLAEANGIMGLNACKYIVGGRGSSPEAANTIKIKDNESARTEQYLDAMCEHIEHVVKTIGPSHIGFGFDLCDSYSAGKSGYPDVASAIHAAAANETAFEPEDCLRNHEEALLLTARLLERGMDEKSVLLIIGQNWWNYFRTHLPNK